MEGLTPMIMDGGRNTRASSHRYSLNDGGCPSSQQTNVCHCLSVQVAHRRANEYSKAIVLTMPQESNMAGFDMLPTMGMGGAGGF